MPFHYWELMKPCRLSTVVIVFFSFDLMQGYFQLAMEESDIKRLHLEPVQQLCTSSLICHLDSQMQAVVSVTWWNNAWGNQQFVTLLLYLHEICIFAPTIDDMLDWIELVFDRLKQFNLRLSLKHANFSILVYSLWVMFCQLMVFQLTHKRWKGKKTWPLSRNIKEVQSFLGLASYCRHFINKFAEKAWAKEKSQDEEEHYYWCRNWNNNFWIDDET